jgi:hypothetical protein
VNFGVSETFSDTESVATRGRTADNRRGRAGQKRRSRNGWIQVAAGTDTMNIQKTPGAMKSVTGSE